MKKFRSRSSEPERIDTGDYTPEEYERFLGEIAFINKYFGDRRALRRSLFREIEHAKLEEFSVLDVGSGSGELLRFIAEFAKGSGRVASLAGIDLNDISTSTALSASKAFPEVSTVRGDAFRLPFADGTFDYAISSLFFHHLSDEQIPQALAEMSRVASRGVFVIDLHRHWAAYALYKLFCVAFRISPLVRHDGSLSIQKGFRPADPLFLSFEKSFVSKRIFPFRLVFSQRITAS